MRKKHLFLLPIFKGMSQEQQDQLLPLITLCHIPTGQTIFKQGGSAEYLYILERGKVDIIFKPTDGPELLVTHIANGGIFGWSSTLGREKYTSGATAVMDCQAYRFKGLELRKLCEDYPDTGVVILDRLALAIAERLESTHGTVMSVLNQGMNLRYEL